MKTLLRNLIIGSPLEGAARRILRRVRGAESLELTNASYDRQAFAVMGRVLRADSTCVDVGCHKGDFLREMLRLAPNGTHYAFEPIPEMYAELRTAFPGTHVFNYALNNAEVSAAALRTLSQGRANRGPMFKKTVRT